MALSAPSLQRSILRAFLRSSLSRYSSSQESIRAAVESKSCRKIPDLLDAPKPDRNPFLFLSTLPETNRVRTVDEILQSFISIRPRSRPHLAYSHLLSYILESPNALPLAFAVVQRMLRSGCLPSPQTHLLLSNAWIDCLHKSQSVSSILSEMHSIGYSPDCGTCNYLILSLCKVERFKEAVEVLRGMGRVGCAPDRDSFGALIGELSERKLTNGIVELVKEMVSVHLLSPRDEMVIKAVGAMRTNRDVRRAVEMIEFVESEGIRVGFEAYGLALEGCLEVGRFVLAGKFAVKMTERGFIPYIRVRQRLFEGLVSVGETELASVVRQRFAAMKS